MLPVMVAAGVNREDGATPRVAAGVIEIELPAARLRLKGTVDVAVLRAVLDMLSAAAMNAAARTQRVSAHPPSPPLLPSTA